MIAAQAWCKPLGQPDSLIYFGPTGCVNLGQSRS